MEDGEFQLHICQPCYQIRQNLVHHSCAGRHPGHGHGQSSGQHVGAVGCPLQLSQLPPVQTTTSPSNNNISNNSNKSSSPSTSQTMLLPPTNVSTPSCQCCGVSVVSCVCVKYKHEPDPMCTCDACARFVRVYHIKLDTLCRAAGIEELDLYSAYYDYHCDDDSDTTSEVTTVYNYQDTDSSYRWDETCSNTSFVFSERGSFKDLNSTFQSDFYY